MYLEIDGIQVPAVPDKTLLSLIRETGFDSERLSTRPLAAKIAGEVFNLNYVPVRTKDRQPERQSIRNAMAASNGKVTLLRYCDPAGKDVYNRTAQFVIFLALHRLWPKTRAIMNCMVGKALYVEVQNDAFCAEELKKEIQRIIAEDIPLIRKRIPLSDAIDQYRAAGHMDKAQLLAMRNVDYFDQYSYEDFSDYYYGELAPSTGYVQVWDILPVDGGFMFLYPEDDTPDNVASYEGMPNFLRVCKEGELWCELMECQCVADLNARTENGQIRELIRVNEALHEKQFAQIADTVSNRGIKAVMLAGPSSSGKTTSANRLATQLRVHGKKVILMSLDDYYIDRDKIKPSADGTIDLEHINTIDVALFKDHLKALLTGSSVQIPSFNFKKGKREWPEKILSLDEKTVIIIEGLHALNPALLPDDLNSNLVFKLYVSPLLPLNLDDHNRIPSSLLRLLRRTVRDYRTRGASVQKTMEMWDSVRRGEKRWIYPFQEQADWILNSSTLYELAVLKKFIFPLLNEVSAEDPCYEQVRALVKILNYVKDADVVDEIPPTSIVREFIGGNRYYL